MITFQTLSRAARAIGMSPVELSECLSMMAEDAREDYVGDILYEAECMAERETD